jgi:hypothetical protein
VPVLRNRHGRLDSLLHIVNGTKLEGYLNDRKLLDYTLPEAVSGKVGVWSKTDSISYFDAFTVTQKP